MERLDEPHRAAERTVDPGGIDPGAKDPAEGPPFDGDDVVETDPQGTVDPAAKTQPAEGGRTEGDS